MGENISGYLIFMLFQGKIFGLFVLEQVNSLNWLMRLESGLKVMFVFFVSLCDDVTTSITLFFLAGLIVSVTKSLFMNPKILLSDVDKCTG